MTVTVKEPLTRATPSTGNEVPWARHVVERGQDATLCGKAWDRLDVRAGPVCDACAAEYKRRHPGWPLPGGGT